MINSLLFLILFDPMISVHPRIDVGGIERMAQIMPYIEHHSQSTGIPAWFVAGIIYNESNAKHWVKGDAGRAWGLGQIHCGPGGFSWRPYLKQRRVIRSCQDLLEPDVAVEAIFEIIKYLAVKDSLKRGKIRWAEIATSYHKGETWRSKRWSISKGYFSRVKIFGQYFENLLER